MVDLSSRREASVEDCAYKGGQSNGAWRGRPGMNHAGFLEQGVVSLQPMLQQHHVICVCMCVCMCAYVCVHVRVCMCLKYLISMADAH